MIIHRGFIKTIQNTLRRGGVGVIPTDTLYGIVGSALSKKAVARMYTLRKRNPKKPMIILIGAVSDLKKFGVTLNTSGQSLVANYWPGKVSIILPIRVRDSRLALHLRYLHRGTNLLAFRLPAKKSLRKLLEKTGPLVAPSVNPEGKPPAKTIAEAKRYFGNRVDFYVDGGRLAGKPSKLIKIKNDKVEVLRK